VALFGQTTPQFTCPSVALMFWVGSLINDSLKSPTKRSSKNLCCNTDLLQGFFGKNVEILNYFIIIGRNQIKSGQGLLKIDNMYKKLVIDNSFFVSFLPKN